MREPTTFQSWCCSQEIKSPGQSTEAASTPHSDDAVRNGCFSSGQLIRAILVNLGRTIICRDLADYRTMIPIDAAGDAIRASNFSSVAATPFLERPD